MAKAVRYFYGTDTFGRSAEVCESESGVFFARNDEQTKFGLQTTKWREHTPTWSKTVTNAYSGEVSERVKPVMEWGFQVLRELDDMSEVRFRLPY